MRKVIRNNLGGLLIILAVCLIVTGLAYLIFSPLGSQTAKADPAGTEGLIAYGEGGVVTPRYRTWNGTSFDPEGSAQPAAATIQWVVVKSSPVNPEEKLMGVLSTDNNLYVQTWDGTSWISNWSTLLDMSMVRLFDIAYEQNSGGAIVVFGDGTTQLKYRKRVSGIWDTSNQSTGTLLDDIPYLVRLEPKPESNDIMAAVVTNGTNLHALRWNGETNTWGDQVQMITQPASKDMEVFDIAYERSSGDAFVIWGEANRNLKYREFTTSWQPESTAYSAIPDTVVWLDAAGDQVSISNNLSVIMILNNETIEFGAWNGSLWVPRPAAESSKDKGTRYVSTAFDQTNGKAMFVFRKGPSRPYQRTFFWRTWTSTDGFSGVNQGNQLGAVINWLQLKADNQSNEMMAISLDDGGGINYWKWNGLSWTPPTEIESIASSAYTECFMFAWNRVPVPPASWKAPENTPITDVNKEENIRLRFQITNVGSEATDYDYLLEYSSKIGTICGDNESFTTVPVAPSTEHFEMTESTYFANGDSTTAQLTVPDTYSFVSGKMVEDPSNSSGNISLSFENYTEIEFVFQATANAVDGESYCFQVTNTGTALDEYYVYPELQIAP